MSTPPLYLFTIAAIAAETGHYLMSVPPSNSDMSWWRVIVEYASMVIISWYRKAAIHDIKANIYSSVNPNTLVVMVVNNRVLRAKVTTYDSEALNKRAGTAFS